LERYWDVFPAIRSKLFESAGRAGYLRLKVPVQEIKSTILAHEEFKAFDKAVTGLFSKWRTESVERLMAVAKGEKPKVLIEVLSEELLATFSKSKLVDPYDVYQHLMDYWATTMQDDVYLIAHAGWIEAAKPREVLPVKGKDGKNSWPEEHDFCLSKRRF